MSAKATDKKVGRLPLLQGVLPIEGSKVPAEIVAGITLAALAIPEVMGYTKIAGTPVVTGLYTMLIPMAFFAIFGSSRHLVVGADSATAAILAAGLAGMAATGSAEYVALAGLLAIMAAAFLILARIIRLGFLADFLSRTVLIGFLTGVGVQVALGQISGMLGVKGGGHGPIHQIMADFQQLDQVHYQTVLVAAAVLVVVVGSKLISKKIPGPLIAVAGAIALSWGVDLQSHGVSVLGKVPGGLPTLGLPQVDLSWSVIGKLIPTAFSIFVVILAQSAATSRAYAARYNERFSENVDLVGLGMANLGAGLSGTFVVAGSPTKTQMVDSAGGHSQLSQITTVIIVLVVLLFLTGVLAYMPEVVLSAIVFVIGVNLIDIKGMREIYAKAPSEFWVALITAIVVIFVGVEQGIVLAMFLSLVDHVRRGYRPKNTVIVPDEARGWRTVPVSSPAQFLPGLMVYRYSHSMYYANAEQLSEQVTELVKDAQPPLNWFCIDAAAVDDVDFSAAATMSSIHGILQEQHIRLVFVAVSDDVKAELDRLGLTEVVGEESFYRTGDDLLNAYRQATASDSES